MKRLQVVFALCLVPILASQLNLAKDKKIANGVSATAGQYRFLASYQRLGEHFCGCTILNEIWLLTAGHCIDSANSYKLENVRIVVGSIKLGDTTGVQTKAVLRQYKHRSYTGGVSPNDIGLVRIVSPFNWTTSVRAVYLPNPNSEYNGIAEKAGWGYLRSSYPTASTYMQMAYGITIQRDVCNGTVYPYGAQIIDTQICTVGYVRGNETACQGDSGGPLIVKDNNVDKVQIGVLSWTFSPCGLNGSPTVSTKVSRFINWISCVIYNDPSPSAASCY